jgi:large subunit ribosomal protein L18
MDKSSLKAKRRVRRRAAIRSRIDGTPTRPRLSVYKSLNHFYAQVIDDLAGKTLAAASTRDEGAVPGGGKSGNAPAAAAVGARLADAAKKAGVKAVVFDRGGFKFHGRVKAFAEAARKGGLEF